MLDDKRKFDLTGEKLQLKNISEGDDVIKATQLLLEICKRNGLHFISNLVYGIQLKVIDKEVVYSEE